MESATILAIGDEVLSGEIVNSNAAWLGRELLAIGVTPLAALVVGDEPAAIGAAFRWCRARSDVVITVGGLGPTHDDLTKEVLATEMGRPLAIDPAVRQAIAARHRRGPGHEASIDRQATVIAGAQIWPNPVGTAPGQLLTWQDEEGAERHLILLPGPPRELQAIAETWMLPFLKRRAQRPGLVRAAFAVYDLPESQVAHYLRPLVDAAPVRIGIYTAPGRVEVRFQAARDPAAPQALPTAVVEAARRAQALLPVPLYPLGGPSRAERMVDALQARHQTVATMESLTGGLLASALIDVPGASRVVRGGAVAYQDAVKAALGVPEGILQRDGAVSEACALAMAEAARRRFDADYGLATTGYAGPGGGSEEIPAGSFFVAVASTGLTTARRREVRAGRQGTRIAAVEAALSLLWEALGLPIELPAG